MKYHAKTEAVYIGETGRNLQERVKEHKYAVKRRDENNGIAVHAWFEDHMINWEEAKVRQLEPVTWKRKSQKQYTYNKKREQQLTWTVEHI